MHFLTRLALKKPWVTYLLTAILAGVCVWATITLKMELIPDIELPMSTIVTVYPQAQPDDVMNDVSIPIEEALADIKGVKHITSTSRENVSYVFVECEYGTKMSRVNKAIAQKLETASLPIQVRTLPSTLPQIGENPKLIPLNMNMLPVVTFSLAGDMPLPELARIAQEQVVPELKKIDGVFDVTVEGGEGDKLLVVPSLEKMAQNNVSVGQVAGVLAMAKYTSVGAIRDAYLNAAGLQLKDVADISIGPQPGRSINRTNGKPGVSIQVSKTAEANTVWTANAVTKAADKVRPSLPRGVQLITFLDQSDYIEKSIAELTNNALIGGALAIIVVFLFLVAFKASIITAISIPMSVLIGFLLMHIFNITTNILTLSAMVLAIGRVIDDSIVIVEVSYRHIQQGEKFPQAALNGTREVVNAITSSSISTVIIFVPLAFVGGIVGEMFVPFSLTITFAMFGSLLSALTIVPALTKMLSAKPRLEGAAVKPSWYLRIYTPILKWCLGHRALTLVISTILFLGSFTLLPVIGTSFMPELNTNVATIQVEMPKGATLEEAKVTVAKVEAVIARDADVRAYHSTIGSSQLSGGMMAMMAGGSGSTSSEIILLLQENADGKTVVPRLEKEIAGIETRGKISISRMHAMSAETTSRLVLSVTGRNQEDITTAANALSKLLDSVPGTGEKELILGNPQPKLIIEPDPVKIMSAGLTQAQIEALQPEFLLLRQGSNVAKADISGTTYDIYMPALAQQATSIESLSRLAVGVAKPVTLGSIVNLRTAQQPVEYRRNDRKLAATFTIEITQKDVGAVNRAVQKEIREIDLPEGVEISTGGVAEEMKESFSRMYYSILIAIVLAYIVLVVSFRSFLKPLIIMVSLPLASAGALLGLLVSGHTLGVTGMMGVLMLVGIVLTNAVVMLAYVGQLQKAGMPLYDAIVRGGQTRLRPILMTAITTLIAMLPLAFGIGEGVIMAAELAVVVVGGLFSSTLLTLLVVPVIYSLAYRRREAKKV